MVATDTVVGIAGAVVLVAVMAGVFVYEYNNAPADADNPAIRQQHFEEDYPGLSANDDIDGDGVANFEDDDLDGDGTANAVDSDVGVVVPVSATVAVPPPTGGQGPAFTVTFRVGNGTEHFQGALTYTRAAGGVFPNVAATLSGPAGFDQVQATSTNSGSTYTLAFDIQEPLPAGEYTLTLRQQPTGGLVPVSQEANVAGDLTIHYAAPAEPHDHTTPEK